jgi:hypothetical protein
MRRHCLRLCLRQDARACLLSPGHELRAHALAARVGADRNEVNEALVGLRQAAPQAGRWSATNLAPENLWRWVTRTIHYSLCYQHLYRS